MNKSVRALVVGSAAVLVAGSSLATTYRPRTTQPVSAVQVMTDRFVDAALGSDGDGCGTSPELACRSIQAAIDGLPMAITQNVAVHVAPGRYDGGILIAGRISPNNSRLRVFGTGEGVIITGPETASMGISVIQSSNVDLENLHLEGFPGAGIRVILSSDGGIRNVTLTNNGYGIFLGESETVVAGSVFSGNAVRGVACDGGWVVLGETGSASTLLFSDNGGIEVAGCHASIRSPMTVTGSGPGLLALHGGEIDLNMRDDIGITTTGAGSALTADCHGMIVGYANTCVGACTCEATRFSVCEAGPGPGGGGSRPPLMYQEN